ncbi:BrnA antitoxin family protein [Treponema parvum]|uniref:BrnA antitoxin family protein n=1 Tax=Treponema parvum TaxID=138851 RepID=A0A975F3H1_9SPIR|nr:BrnA antitoxin family protein [Treponema parvum]QTQ13909.1 BrnA antitoxin family protein [Treponema parvum]
MNNEKTLTAERVAEIRARGIDFSDIPEITDFTGFKPRYPQYFKPKREQVSIRLSKYLVDHFKAMGKGWQTKLNDFLMEAVNKGLI